MRSNERATQTPSSRSAVSGDQRRVGLDEAEHRRERRRDHPRALGLRGQPHGAGRQRDVDLDLLGELVRGADRLGEVAVPVLAQLRAGLARSRGSPSLASSGTPITPVEATATWSSRTPPAIAAAPCMRAASSKPRSPGGRVGVAGVGDDHAQRVQPRALLGQHDRRGQHARAREARGAARSPGDEQTIRPRSSPPDGFKPARDARGAEARRAGRPAFSVTCPGISSQRELTAIPPSPAARTSG